ncbi:MAG: SUMF1/EgtB/PvdO family nonheme iron enzyme, partial [Gammaproteobacteria bacterium]|nr:SUMF1/EgtB/PvdO family nonheme iron enzyme [Gammaproteobacteria bacterium]
RSTFTPAFVDALREGKGDLNRDGYVTGTELGVYLAQEVPKYEQQSPQYGKIKEYRLAQGDFVFFLPGGPPPPPGPGIIPPPPVRFLGHLQVNVTVAQAQVTVNGRPVGTASRRRPLNLSNLPAGRVQVKVTAKDHQAQTQWVTIRHGQWVQPVFSLEPIAPALARLTVRSNVNQDKVYVNGQYKGSTRLDLDLPPGEYRITVTKEGYGDWERRIDLRSGAKEVLRARLEPSVTSVVTPPREAEKLQHKDEWRDPVTGMEFVWVPEGCFRMGSNEGESDEKPVHEVCVDGFWMGKYEVAQGQWKQVMGKNPSKFKKGNDHPVETVSWNDVQRFIKKLNFKGHGRFRLPTEAEWEYACRSGGKKEKYCGGNDVYQVAWHGENWKRGHHPVGGKASNGLGLYDMSGNAWEWVSDWYDENYYRNSPKNNPKGPSSGATRVNRGGGWLNFQADVRAANRYYDFVPHGRARSLGFRLLRTHP